MCCHQSCMESSFLIRVLWPALIGNSGNGVADSCAGHPAPQGQLFSVSLVGLHVDSTPQRGDMACSRASALLTQIAYIAGSLHGFFVARSMCQAPGPPSQPMKCPLQVFPLLLLGVLARAFQRVLCIRGAASLCLPCCALMVIARTNLNWLHASRLAHMHVTNRFLTWTQECTTATFGRMT